jgi:beta-glucosidase-like glycosyl hydrolase
MVDGPGPGRLGERIVNYTEAFGAGVNAGLGTYYGYWVTNFRESMADLLGLNGAAAAKYGNGEVLGNATLRAAAKRMIVPLLRLGFYDSYRADYPFSHLLGNTSWGLLDSPAHRAVAREVAAKSTALLKNSPPDGCKYCGPVLPLVKPKSIAVVGPFAACSGPQKGYGPAANNSDPRYLTALEGPCYLYSYNGELSNITSIYGGIKAARECDRVLRTPACLNRDGESAG